MGAHLNYHSIIYTLINLKDRLKLAEDEKYRELIDELTKITIDPLDEDQELPTNQDLADTLNLSRTKTNTLFKSLHQEILDNTFWHPIEVRDYVHVLYNKQKDS